VIKIVKETKEEFDEVGNPQMLKKGDRLLVVQSLNYPRFVGQIVNVINVCYDYINVKVDDESNTFPLYFENKGKVSNDRFCFATRKARIELKEKYVISMKNKILDVEAEIKELKRFKDDEEKLAYELNEILKNKGDVAAIAEVLRKRNKTNLL
jgi:hypothetical protein